MPVQSIPQFPVLKGIVASNQPLAEPKGAIVRGSNLLLPTRGALDPCDGSLVLFDYAGQVQTTFGRIMATFLFEPTGVAPYYLAVAKAPPGVHLSVPQNLTTSAGGAHSFTVSAIDGAGGETPVSNTITGGTGSVLTWNVVPNATGYNVYEGGLLLFGPGLPVPQPAAGTLTQSYTVTGTELTALSLSISSMSFNSVQANTPPGSSTYTYTVQLAAAAQTLTMPNPNVTISGVSNPNLTGSGYSAIAQPTPTSLVVQVSHAGATPNPIYEGSGTGGTLQIQGTARTQNSTQPTVLYRMPTMVGSPATVPITYNASNIVAYYPADPFVPNPELTPAPFSPRNPPGIMPFNVPVPLPAGPGSGRAGSGGGGPSGGIGPGGATGGATVSGGIQGNVSFIPQFKQFTNQAIIALGNGYPPQIFSDLTTPINPATIANISSITVDAFGVVTVNTSTANGAIAGGNMLIAGVSDPVFNGAFTVLSTPSSTQFKIQNTAAIGHTGTGGSTATSSLPIQSNFVPAYPVWTATTVYGINDIIVPATQPTPAIYLIAVQGGTSASVEPTPWPTTTNQIKADGTILWKVGGPLNSGAPPPPGAAHIEIYAGSLWVWNTAATNTANGLDGPCSLRMSNQNNANSWNPVNQAFLDKDDGQEGMGLAKFTITALGIPPEGSLVAFKDYEAYQILGVFGASSFAIQPLSSDMGCIAPRTIDFVPGFGIMRYTHLGVASFNGVKDEIMSEQLRPYFFPSDDVLFSDITVIDANWIAVAWGAQTANPPMYCIATPIGTTSGQLTRLFCFDLVLKAWVIVDLPFNISTMSQFRGQATNPITVFGGFQDATIQRWQAGDTTWMQNAFIGGNSYAQFTDQFVPVTGALTTLNVSAVASFPDFGFYMRATGQFTNSFSDTPPPGSTNIGDFTGGAGFYGAWFTTTPGVVSGSSVVTYTGGPANAAAAGLIVLFPTVGTPVVSHVASGPSGALSGGFAFGGGVAVVASGQVLFIQIQGGEPLQNAATITDNHNNVWLPFPVISFISGGLGANIQLYMCPNPVPANDYTFTMQTSPPGGTIVIDAISSCIAVTNLNTTPSTLSTNQPVNWSFQGLTVASGDTDQRVYVRRVVFTAINSGQSGTVQITWRRDRVPLGTRIFNVQGTVNFDLDCATGFTGKQFDAIISGNCNPTIDGLTWEVEPRPAGVVVSI